jgi:hypothetical protein
MIDTVRHSLSPPAPAVHRGITPTLAVRPPRRRRRGRPAPMPRTATAMLAPRSTRRGGQRRHRRTRRTARAPASAGSDGSAGLPHDRRFAASASTTTQGRQKGGRR